MNPEDFPTYGAYLRAKNMRVGYCKSASGLDASRQKRWDRELAEYADARRQGVQPAGTTTAQTRRALDISDKTGTAYKAA